VLVRLVDEYQATAGRLPWREARTLAVELCRELEPFCERIRIAGSIRRRKPLVKDIELVVVPKLESTATDLFGETTATRDLLHERLTAMLESGEIEHRLDKNGRPAFGRAMKRIRYQGFAVDVFTATPETWGVTFVIRTGSAEFSTRIVTAQRIGGLLPDDMLVRGWQVWRTLDGSPVPVAHEARADYPITRLAPIPTREEAHVFEAIGLEWVRPEDR
jgi:DNA polymerase/3'-5' exonuclease PolX